MDFLNDLLSTQDFQLGFVVGVVTVALVVVCVGMLPSTRPLRRGLVGPAWVFASLVAVAGWFGLHRSGSVPWYVPVSLILLMLGMEVGVRWDKARRLWLARAMLLAPGAAILAFATEFGRPWWLPWLVFLGTMICGPLVADFDVRVARLGLGPVLFAVTVFGAYVYLPENDMVRGLLGVALPFVLVGIPFRAARLGDGGSVAAVAFFFWIVAREANNVPIQSWVMIFALGLLLVEPIGHRYLRTRILGDVRQPDTGPWNMRRRLRRMQGIGGSIPTAALQLTTVAVDLAMVVYVARVAGLSERYPGDSALPMVLLLPAVAGGLLFGVLVGISPRFHHRRMRLDSRGSALRTSTSGRRRRVAS